VDAQMRHRVGGRNVGFPGSFWRCIRCC